MSTSEPLVFSLNKSGSDIRATFDEIASADHIHTEDGRCYKDRSQECTAPKWIRPGTYLNPFPGQVLRDVNFGDPSWYEENVGESRPVVYTAEAATVVTSEVIRGGGDRPLEAGKMHKPVLDIDLPVKVLDSSTAGHHHLFIDKEMSWEQYAKLLDVLAEVGIIEEGYSRVSQGSRKHTAVRLPWVKKGANHESV